MTKLSPPDAVLLLDLEMERRARAANRSRAQLEEVKQQSREGNIRPYVKLQWPTVVLDDWQWDALEALFNPLIREVFIKGNTGCGKGAVSGIGVCAYYDIWPDARVVITRDSADRAVALAFGEVAKWWDRMRYKPDGTLLTNGIYHHKQHLVMVSNPDKEEGFRGVHSEHVLIWMDEATSPNLENKYRLARTQAKKFLCLGNPSTLSGSFRDAFPVGDPDTTQTIVSPYGMRRCITVSGWDCTNVKQKCLAQPVAPVGGIEIDGTTYVHGEPIPPEDFAKCEPIIPGQTCYDEFMALLNDPDLFVRNVFALGKFPDADPAKQIILPGWLDEPTTNHARWSGLWERVKHRKDWVRKIVDRWLGVEAAGLDVAASSDGDQSILVVGGKRGVRAIHACQFRDTQQTVAWVLETFRDCYGIDLTEGGVPIAIDWGGGYGNAVGDPLRSRGCLVVEVAGASAPGIEPDKYANKRAELYGEFGRRLDPQGDFAESWYALPPDMMLRAELTAPQKIYKGENGQKFLITPKDRRGASQNFKGQTLKEMLGRSPDRADAVVNFHEAMRHRGISLRQALDAGFF